MSDFKDQSQRMLSPFDRIVDDLQQLRLDGGDVPYAEIVRRISRNRIAQGVAPDASRPARSTVYDAFRRGRTRLNLELVSEIVRALDGTEKDIESWRLRCLQARREQAATEDTECPGSEEPVVPERPNAPLAEPEAAKETKQKIAVHVRKVILALGCALANLLGFWLVANLGVPLYLDMLGTAVAAMMLGPWAGVGVAVATNLLGSGITDSSSIPFGLVNVTGALLWGYGALWVRRKGALRRYFALNLLVGFACTVVATSLLVLLFGGGTGHASEGTRMNLESFGLPMFVAVFQSNLLYSLADKMLVGFIALAVMAQLNGWLRGSIFEDLESDITRRLDIDAGQEQRA
ncbi:MULTISPECIES: ECF transporter S component [unclassified Glutamicibacter]|uniref:ECF transporter S component n=2 Tax=unclassified Glutamicibacter TaxID=2627139 RepID=UPI0011433D88|nr:ECF transporter S component [Glutamicibacter sp. BW80]